MIVVIADDITGAAEIAGIARRHGRATELVTWASPDVVSAGARPPAHAATLSPAHAATQVMVIATDTRSADRAGAVAVVEAVARLLPADGSIRLFKKTDSALRGHIAAEVGALIAATHYSHALLIAQNPSKGRVVSDGTYYIDSTPLAETAFRHDPEFPALTSRVDELLGDTDHITAPDATCADDIAGHLARADHSTLVAGAADCFEAFLTLQTQHAVTPCTEHHAACHEVSHHAPFAHGSSFIIVCGSTQSRSLRHEPFVSRAGAEEIGLPADVFHGRQEPDAWLDSLQRSYNEHHAIVMTVGQPSTGGKAYAVRLRRLMAEAVSRLVSSMQPAMLVIEGGATAFAALQRLGWQSFTVTAELSPGVVSMTHGSTTVVLKPGSYPWGNLFADN